jgi:segregation and condensation protein B
MATLSELSETQIKHVVEAALLAANEPLSMNQLSSLFEESPGPGQTEISKALESLSEECSDRGIELREVASGFRLQVRQDYQPYISRLWSERPKRYSRAMLETLALVAYRQPITRGEIEEVRGVSLSSNIIRTLQERDWIRVVGHRDVPGKPALFGTTRGFLDYFNLASLDELPTLAEIKDLDSLEPELELEPELAADTNDEQDSESEFDEMEKKSITATPGEGQSQTSQKNEDRSGHDPDHVQEPSRS